MLVEGSVQPGGHHADVECGVAKAKGGAGLVDVLRRAVKRLDQHLPGRPPQRHYSFEQHVDQFVRQLADEMALPVVAIDSVAGAEHLLLGQERVGPHGVVGEAARGAQRPELPRVCVWPGVTGCDGDGWR